MARFFDPGLVMLYTPRNTDELEMIWRLVEVCHRHVCGDEPSETPGHGSAAIGRAS